jgi:hypothetical protein
MIRNNSQNNIKEEPRILLPKYLSVLTQKTDVDLEYDKANFKRTRPKTRVAYIIYKRT